MYISVGMSEQDREEFKKWYNAKIEAGAIFDFKYEMEEYCRSDENILRRECGKFGQLLIEQSGLDPLTESYTIAQSCSNVWKKNYMPEACIAIPPEGYPNQKNYSIKAVRWLQSVAYKSEVVIKHALNVGEVKIRSAG